ncbi:hypothetical protein SAMN05444166_7279 [Singulisphaera sp. GP187]|nr:hypothetical protein SAMN05444166_7279 [Singulisphaera sp. GP187]
MFNNSAGQNDNRSLNGPRNYRVRLSRFGSAPKGDHSPSPLTVFISATSSLQARMNAQGSHPGYTVTDVTQA